MNDKRTRDGSPVSPESIRAFYDVFSDTRMHSYLYEKNLRIEKAVARILPFVATESTVLEVGCGLGLVTERVAEIASKGSVWACDISEKNILSARQRVKTPNVHFRCADIIRGFNELREWISKPIQLLLMVDVLEHLPLEDHATLFRNLRSILEPDSTAILTFPSAQYQRHLREKNPKELQIIDEIIELTHLVEVASTSGFFIKHFSLEDVWLRNQYVHCVLKTSLALEPVEDQSPELDRALQEIGALIAPGETIILVEEAQWGTKCLPGRHVLPFLERNGEYWGPPPDDETAVSELQRLHQAGANFIAFGWPAFWWLDYYKEFHQYLRSSFRCLVDNERVLVFDLRH